MFNSLVLSQAYYEGILLYRTQVVSASPPGQKQTPSHSLPTTSVRYGLFRE